MKILLVPQGESPNGRLDGQPCVVICRGDTHNLWINHKTEETGGYTELTEGQAMVFGLSANPGTPDPDYVRTIVNQMSNRFERNVNNDSPPDQARDDGVGMDGGTPPSSVKELLDNVRSLPPDNEEFQRPWDVEQWNTPAGEDPKRTPIHEIDQRENRT